MKYIEMLNSTVEELKDYQDSLVRANSALDCSSIVLSNKNYQHRQMINSYKFSKVQISMIDNAIKKIKAGE